MIVMTFLSKKITVLLSSFFVILNVSASTMKSVQVLSVSSFKQPILIQGPMPIEANFFASKLKNVQVEHTATFTFFIGTLNNYPVIVSKTGKGLENTAAATAVAIERYKPIAIINQGTSGGHDRSLKVGDIVLGKRTVNQTNFKTPHKSKGEGSDPLVWLPMDIMASEGSAGEGEAATDAEKIRYYQGSTALINAANAVKHLYTRGKIVEGTIASGNFWNNEIDRIDWLHHNFGSSTEEMEGSAAAMIASAYGVPMLGIRVLSNNITNGGKYDPTTAIDCQEFVIKVVEQYITNITSISDD
jgi:adenosylhomocysteine nucleosidase